NQEAVPHRAAVRLALIESTCDCIVRVREPHSSYRKRLVLVSLSRSRREVLNPPDDDGRGRILRGPSCPRDAARNRAIPPDTKPEHHNRNHGTQTQVRDGYGAPW